MNASTCRQKTARGNVYDTLNEAQTVAARISDRAGFRVRAFRCPVCRRCHVGRQTRDGRLRKNR